MTSDQRKPGDRVARLPIVQYWDKPEVPPDVAELLATVGAYNPGRPHLVFDEVRAATLIEEHFGPREAAAFAACAVPAMQADYFRCCALYAMGGIWLDVDYHCLAALDGLLEAGRGILVEGPRGQLTNGILAFGTRHHPFLALAIDIATTNIEHRLFNRVWIVTGPGILTALVNVARTGTSEPTLGSVRAALTNGDLRRGDRVYAYLDSLGAVVGDGTPVVEAFAGVEVAPPSAMHELVRGTTNLEYKETEAHFPNFRSSIYRVR